MSDANARISLEESADRAGVSRLLDAVEAWLVAHAPHADYAVSARLIAEELLLNSIEHGEAGAAKGAVLSVDLVLNTADLRLCFRDRGVEYDPSSEAPPDLDSEIEDRRIGGLGVFLVQELAQSVSYHREGDVNVVNVVLAGEPEEL